MITIEPQTIIHYDDPAGLRLDLQRSFRRTIKFKMPADYRDAEVEPIEQDALFVREQCIYEDGTTKLTPWHSDDPYWAHYDVPEIKGYRPNQTEVSQENLTINSKRSAEIVITYEPVSNASTDSPVESASAKDNPNSVNAVETDNETRPAAQFNQRSADAGDSHGNSLDQSALGDQTVDMSGMLKDAMNQMKTDNKPTSDNQPTSGGTIFDQLDGLADAAKQGESITDIIAKKNATEQKNAKKPDHSGWSNARPQNSATPNAKSASTSVEKTTESVQSTTPAQPETTQTVQSAPTSAQPAESSVQAPSSATANTPTVQAAPAIEKPVAKPFIKAWQAPRHAVLIPLSTELSYLRQTARVAETLNHLQELGYFYRQNDEYKAKTYAPVML